MPDGCWAVILRTPFRKQFANFGSHGKDKSPSKTSSKSESSTGSARLGVLDTPTEDPEELARRLAQQHIGVDCLAGSAAYMQPKNLEQSIISGKLTSFVQLPKFICREEWIASHGKFRGWA